MLVSADLKPDYVMLPTHFPNYMCLTKTFNICFSPNTMSCLWVSLSNCVCIAIIRLYYAYLYLIAIYICLAFMKPSYMRS